MNKLQLVQRVRLESGIGTGSRINSVSALSTPGLNLDRDAERMVGWVDDAWRDLQMLPYNWRWMKRKVAFETQPDVWQLDSSDIDPLISIAKIDTTAKRRVRASTIPDDWSVTVASEGLSIASMPPGQSWPLEPLPSDVFHERFGYSLHTPGRPQFWATDTDGSLLLGPTPDTAYAVEVPYVRNPHVMRYDNASPGFTPAGMATDAESYDSGPPLPEKHHMIIVWLALWQYGAYDSAPEVTARAKVNYNTMLSALIADQGEPLTWA